MSFVTKPDFSNNRQVKQFQFSSTQLSGTTVFGVDDVLIPINFTGDTINIDALQNIRTRGLIFPNTIPEFTGSTYQLLGRDNSTGKVVEVTGISGGTGGINTDDYTTNVTFNNQILEFTRLSGGTYSADTSNLTWQRASSTFGGSSDVTENLIPGQADSFTSVIVHNGSVMAPDMVTNTIKNKGFAGLDITGNGAGSSVYAIRLKPSNPNNGNLEIGDSTNDVNLWNPVSEGRKNTVHLRRSYRGTVAATETSVGDYELTGVYANNPVNFDDFGDASNSYYAAFESNPIVEGTYLTSNPQQIFALRGSGRVLLSDYGSGLVTGTTTFGLGVDASGRVVETGLGPLEAIDEGNGVGYVVRDRNEANFGNVGFGAWDLSVSNSPSTTLGATGTYAFAQGENLLASGYASYSTGFGNTATGTFSISMGYLNDNNEYATYISGYNNTANGGSGRGYGFISGRGNVKTGGFGNNLLGTALINTSNSTAGVTVVGRANVNPEVGELFVVGNGTHTTTALADWAASAVRSTAFSVSQDGSLRAHQYGSGTYTGTTTSMLGSDTNGNIIESERIVDITLSTAQILASNSTPIVVIPAQGTGKQIIIESVFCYSDIITQYTTTVGNLTLSIGPFYSVSIANNSASEGITHGFIQDGLSNNPLPNTAYEVSSNADGVTGAGTIRLIIKYKTIDL